MRSLRLFVLLALLPSAVIAQGNPRMTGLTAGFNLSRFGGEDVSDVTTDGRVGLAVGVFGSFLLSDAFAFQPEILFIQKGADFVSDDGTGGAFRLDYLQIPLLARLRLSTGEAKAVPFITFGPAIAFRIGCDGGVSTPTGFVSRQCDDISPSGVAGTDFSLIGGAGVEISNLIVSVRYDYSFSQLKLLPEVQKVYNRGFAIMAAYGFRAW
jgi:hypothetical protein